MTGDDAIGEGSRDAGGFVGAPFVVVLASASPRRRELLSAAGVGFEVRPADVDEDLGAFESPTDAALELARRKALSGARAWLERETRPALVIGADTIVAVATGEGMRLLGKPADPAEALEMLGWLSGSIHDVVTAVCAVRTADGALRCEHERTRVHMREILAEERRAYVESGEWRDKAGGYAIQETADRFVVSLREGGYDNVVGLPVALTLRLLGELGWRGPS